jgi:hypothetical protein
MSQLIYLRRIPRSSHPIQSNRQGPNTKAKHLPNNNVDSGLGCRIVVEEEVGVEVLVSSLPLLLVLDVL